VACNHSGMDQERLNPPIRALERDGISLTMARLTRVRPSNIRAPYNRPWIVVQVQNASLPTGSAIAAGSVAVARPPLPSQLVVRVRRLSAAPGLRS